MGIPSSTIPTIEDDMHSTDDGPKNQSGAYTDIVSHLRPFVFHGRAVRSTNLRRIFANAQLVKKQSVPSESGRYYIPASSHGPGDPSSFPTEDATNVEAPKVKCALTNKQLKKKARKLKQAQKVKEAPGAISSDKSGVLSASAEALSPSQQSSMPALNDTIAHSENKIGFTTENKRTSKFGASDSTSDLRGQLLAQRMEFRQRIKETDKEFEALMAELKQQGTAVEARYAGLLSSIRQWADELEVPADVNAPVSSIYYSLMLRFPQRRLLK